MSNPRFVPRVYTPEPELFGRASLIRWRTEMRGPNEEDRCMAAQIQHAYAFVIRRKGRKRFGSISGYALAANVPYDRMIKVLRGEALLRLEDIAQAERLLGDIQKEATDLVVAPRTKKEEGTAAVETNQPNL